MFENLTDKLDGVFRKLSGQGKITEKNIQDSIREIRIALLEADVNYKIVKNFVGKVKEKALGQEVVQAVSPGQFFVKIVHEEMMAIMGLGHQPLKLQDKKFYTVMLVGLQGSGKTTFAGKLGIYLRKKFRKPLLVAGDIYRPAAIDQLKTIGKSIDIPVYSAPEGTPPPEICKQAHHLANQNGQDTLIIDTAGRLHIDENLMEELKQIRETVNIDEILFVADAMTGQEAVNIAKTFEEKVGMDGVCLTKLDGDARGGAALSIKYVTGKPIKFVGVGETLKDLEEFHPERMVTRILGMGDVVSLVEKAQEAFDEKAAKKLEKKLRRSEFDLNDFLQQMQQMKKLGPFQKILGMVPGMSGLRNEIDFDDAERHMRQTEAIICSMTQEERATPKVMNGGRRLRIARGSGTKVEDVNRLLKGFEEMKKVMKMFNNPKTMKRMQSMMPKK